MGLCRPDYRLWNEFPSRSTVPSTFLRWRTARLVLGGRKESCNHRFSFHLMKTFLVFYIVHDSLDLIFTLVDLHSWAETLKREYDWPYMGTNAAWTNGMSSQASKQEYEDQNGKNGGNKAEKEVARWSRKKIEIVCFVAWIACLPFLSDGARDFVLFANRLEVSAKDIKTRNLDISCFSFSTKKNILYELASEEVFYSLIVVPTQ